MKEYEIISNSMNFVANYIGEISKELDFESITRLIDKIVSARRIFLLGAGRSGLEARAFAMRLMHLGFDVHIVGDVTSPVPEDEDLVIVISGSGDTPSVVNTALSIQKKGATLAAITIHKNSTVGRMSNMVIVIPVNIENIDYNIREHMLPMGTLFEVTVHVFLDAIISQLKERTGTTEAMMKDRHMLSEYVGII